MTVCKSTYDCGYTGGSYTFVHVCLSECICIYKHELVYVLVLIVGVPVHGNVYSEVLATIFHGIVKVDCLSLTSVTGNILCGN